MADVLQNFEQLRISIAELCSGAGNFESRIFDTYRDRLRDLFSGDETLGIHGELISAAILCEKHLPADGTKMLPFNDRDREFVCNALLTAMLHAHGEINKQD